MKPINHSTLAKALMDVIKMSAGGVIEEGGPLVGGESAPEPTNQMAAAPKSVPDNGFRLGASSEKELVGVKPELVRVARRALQLSLQDFCVFDGLRTAQEQASNVARGVSKTQNSKHMLQSDGFGHALDLVPYTTRPVWDWKLIWPIVAAVDLAATEMGIANHLRWGGAWDRTLADFGGDWTQYKAECEAYAARHPGKDFLDGPHFEWVN